MAHIWALIEYQERHELHLLLGVFSTPEAAVRWLRKTSAQWIDRPRTADFARQTDDLWVLRSEDATYSISRWEVDNPRPIHRFAVEGATA